MENSPATGQDEGRLPGVGAKGPLGPGRAVDGRQLGEQMPGFLPRLLSRGVGLEGGPPSSQAWQRALGPSPNLGIPLARGRPLTAAGAGRTGMRRCISFLRLL